MKILCTTCSMNGPKRRNEDAVFGKQWDEAEKGLFVVCDGMGGLHMGDKASQAVIDVFATVWDKHRTEWGTDRMLREAVALGKEAIDKLSKQDVGTTIVMAAVEGDSVTVAHLGDSRAYYIRPEAGLIYQTEDHITIGQEGWPYVSKGFFNFREVDAPTVRPFRAQKGDLILLCSDGVYGCYRGTALADLLQTEMEITTMMSNIIGYCDEYAHDNYSAIIIKFE